jgi:hypothetical protein
VVIQLQPPAGALMAWLRQGGGAHVVNLTMRGAGHQMARHGAGFAQNRGRVLGWTGTQGLQHQALSLMTQLRSSTTLWVYDATW